ncbi:MAG TPA: response regulator [Rhodocyclaceae bacterium]|nr:response regulator [Rhodocyclaceae bacterium]
MSATGRKGRVLCVDDEPHVLRALQWLLKKDFEVQTAASAGEGMRLIQRNDFDVVISDQRMPGISGVEFLREVRKTTPRSVRILLTGYAEMEAMVRSVNESEVYRFITKPWDIKGLPILIDEAVAIAQSDPVVDIDEVAMAAPDRPIAAEAASTAAAPAVDMGSSMMGSSIRAAAPAAIALQGVEREVLVMDDDPLVHQAVSQAYGRPDLVKHAFTLADAIRILDERPIGVIVSEIKVARMDATRLIRLMKHEHPEIVSVVFSNVQDAEYVIALINQGQVYRFIPKPFKAGFIKVIIDTAMKRHDQLLKNPELHKRFKVEATTEGAMESLLKDVESIAASTQPLASATPVVTARPTTAAAAPPEQGKALLGRITMGFRKLFGG